MLAVAIVPIAVGVSSPQLYPPPSTHLLKNNIPTSIENNLNITTIRRTRNVKENILLLLVPLHELFQEELDAVVVIFGGDVIFAELVYRVDGDFHDFVLE